VFEPVKVFLELLVFECFWLAAIQPSSLIARLIDAAPKFSGSSGRIGSCVDFFQL